MNVLDYAIVALYLGVMLWLGLRFKKNEAGTDYFLGGRQFGWFALCMSTMATQLSAISFVSAPAFVGLRAGGGMQWLTFEFAVPLAMIALIVLLGPVLRRSGVVSVYGFLEKRFGRGSRTLVSALFVVSRGLSTGVSIYTIGLILSSILGVPFWQTMAVLGGVTIVYSLEGVIDYYTTLSWVVRGGKRVQVTALSELETVNFPAPVGDLEAFHTAGGLSTMAFRYEGRIPSMEYKTLRYPGHAAIMKTIRDLGLLDLEPVDVKGTSVIPRDVFVSVVAPKLTMPDSHDLLALRVTVAGTKDGQPANRQFDVVDLYDEVHGVSAMMRTTGYSLSITGQMQVRGQVSPPGVWTPDECMPAEAYIAELRARGIVVRETSA